MVKTKKVLADSNKYNEHSEPLELFKSKQNAYSIQSVDGIRNSALKAFIFKFEKKEEEAQKILTEVCKR